MYEAPEMVDYLEREIRQVSCSGCGAQPGQPCVNYPSGKPADSSHPARYFKALDAAVLPLVGYPQLLVPLD